MNIDLLDVHVSSSKQNTYYSVGQAIPDEERMRRMRTHAAMPLRRLKLHKGQPRTGALTIACYGPSLADTWQQIEHPFVTVSGAHDFMASRGMLPDLHVECDPRPHKIEFLQNILPGTRYCIATCCHPDMFLKIAGRQIEIWHMAGEPIVQDQIELWRKDPTVPLIGGGSTAGLRALSVGWALGWRDFNIHGMDCSYRGEQQWAGAHPSGPHGRLEATCNGKVFQTSDIMWNAASDFMTFMRMANGCKFSVFGDGLLAEILKTMQSRNTRDTKEALSHG